MREDTKIDKVIERKWESREFETTITLSPPLMTHDPISGLITVTAVSAFPASLLHFPVKTLELKKKKCVKAEEEREKFIMNRKKNLFGWVCEITSLL